MHLKKQIRYVVSKAETTDELLHDLLAELQFLVRTDAVEVDTTLIIHPGVSTDFMDYNDFLENADQALVELGLEGVVQIAGFHPHYQFAGTAPDDITNYTNRSPYPTLHLLREDSLTKAIDSYPKVDDIPEVNMKTLNDLGLAGWKKLGITNS